MDEDTVNGQALRSSRRSGDSQGGPSATPLRAALRQRGMRCLALALPLAFLLGTVLPAAAPARTATESSSEARQARAATVAEEREQRLAQRRKEAEELRAARKAERLEILAAKRRAREAASGTKGRDFGRVEASCSQVTFYFTGFPQGTNTVAEIVTIDGEHLGARPFTFTGPEAHDTVPIMELEGNHRIDARATWGSGQSRSGWDISSTRLCGDTSEPKFTIGKLQTLIGASGGYVTAPLTGEVGQKVGYEIVVSNVGDVSMAFTNFTDPNCDPGTLTGGPGGPLAPGVFTKFFCTHVLTLADESAGTYTNTAGVVGTPNILGGEQIHETSNTVVVNIPPNKVPTREPTKKGPGPEGNQDGKGTSGGSTPGGAVGVLASSGTQLPRLEALGVISSVPSLSGRPEGCVRSSLLVSIKAKNVKSVTFYLDGHRLKTLTARSARRGRIAVRVQTSRLKPGVHRLTAKITMIPNIASAKTVTVSRSLKFARCASARVSPKFTG